MLELRNQVAYVQQAHIPFFESGSILNLYGCKSMNPRIILSLCLKGIFDHGVMATTILNDSPWRAGWTEQSNYLDAWTRRSEKISGPVPTPTPLHSVKQILFVQIIVTLQTMA